MESRRLPKGYPGLRGRTDTLPTTRARAMVGEPAILIVTFIFILIVVTMVLVGVLARRPASRPRYEQAHAAEVTA